MTPPNAGAPALVTVASPTDRTELAMPTTQTPTQTTGTSIRVAFAFDHAGGGVLSPATCLWLLGNEQLGRVAFRADGEVLVLPVNYVMDGEAVAFRTAVGSKLTAAIEEDAVRACLGSSSGQPFVDRGDGGCCFVADG
ncbi:pyridoxamine 5'-phosphate oxidase family protein [Frankia sp. CcWB3]